MCVCVIRICVCACVCRYENGCVHPCKCMWRSETDMGNVSSDSSLLCLLRKNFSNMNITISAGQQKISAETKQPLGRQKLISRELMLVNMEFSKYVQYASETDDKK